MPKISVIIPVYNAEKYLKQCLDSVINQTLHDIEIICVNDGSTDNSQQIIDEYAQKDNRIRVIKKDNSGLGPTMNTGFKEALGEYIGIVESDDYVDIRMYENLFQVAQEYDSDIVKSSFYNYFQNTSKTRVSKVKWDNEKIPQNRSFNITECGLFLRYHPSVWTCIYKKEFLQSNKIYYPNISGASWADNPFQVQTMCLAKKINYTPDAYYYWRRQNRFDSDDLKDYNIPFERSFEINEWLKANNICDAEILKNLYLRELAYICIVLGMQHINDITHCYSLVKNLLAQIDVQLILNSPDIRSKYKEILKNLIKNPQRIRSKILFKKIRRNLVSIRWNKWEKEITLFGKTILTNNKEIL